MQSNEFFKSFLEILKSGKDFGVSFVGKHMVFKSDNIFVQCTEKEGRMVVADGSGIIKAFCFYGFPYGENFIAFCKNAKEYCLRKKAAFDACKVVPQKLQRDMLHKVYYSEPLYRDLESLLKKVESLSGYEHKAKKNYQSYQQEKKLMEIRMMEKNQYEYE